MFILVSNDHKIKSTKKILINKCNIKDLSFVDVILKIKTSRTFDGLVLFQSCYVEKVLNKFSKCENSIVKTLVDMNVYLFKNKGEGIDQLKYSRIIESFIYVYTKPNIIYSVNKSSRFTNNLSIYHWKAI